MNEYETICKKNEELISKGWIVAKRSSNYTYSNITLPQKENVLSQIYLFLGREKKSDRRQKLTKLFTTFMSGGDETVEKYCKKQLENLEQNKAVEFFNGDYEKLKSVLECCIALKNLPQEMYYRNSLLSNLAIPKSSKSCKEKSVPYYLSMEIFRRRKVFSMSLAC